MGGLISAAEYVPLKNCGYCKCDQLAYIETFATGKCFTLICKLPTGKLLVYEMLSWRREPRGHDYSVINEDRLGYLVSTMTYLPSYSHKMDVIRQDGHTIAPMNYLPLMMHIYEHYIDSY